MTQEGLRQTTGSVKRDALPLEMSDTSQRRHSWMASTCWVILILVVVAAALVFIRDPKTGRAAIVAGVCLILWLSELIPLYATTLLLWVAMPLLLGRLDPRAFSFPGVLSAAANPVLALFFAGLTLSVAGRKYGIDAWIAAWMVRASRGRRRLLLAAAMIGTAVLSMWMSNIAAAAMMIATLDPLFGGQRGDAAFRRALMLGVAFAADFGGMGTPIGTGPNAIAIAAVSARNSIDFLDWMLFGVPMAAVMVILSYALLVALHRVSGSLHASTSPRIRLTRSAWCVVVTFCLTVVAWLLEPFHGVPSAVVGLAAAVILFGSRLLNAADLAAIEWGTLLLIAGGLTLGDLFDRSGLARAVASNINWNAMPPMLLILCLVLACAVLSAVASNTAAAAIAIQLGMGIAPSDRVAILIALGASMGVPFVISTPPNAMAYVHGRLRSRDLLLPGVILMLLGCALLVLIGPALLSWTGLR